MIYKLALSPYETYVQPVMNKDGIKITMQTSYGGSKSEAVPCGFYTQYVVEKTRRSKKSATYRKNKKAKALGYNFEKKVSGSLAPKLGS